jgi:hypothetical protein
MLLQKVNLTFGDRALPQPLANDIARVAAQSTLPATAPSSAEGAARIGGSPGNRRPKSKSPADLHADTRRR